MGVVGKPTGFAGGLRMAEKGGLKGDAEVFSLGTRRGRRHAIYRSGGDLSGRAVKEN